MKLSQLNEEIIDEKRLKDFAKKVGLHAMAPLALAGPDAAARGVDYVKDKLSDEPAKVQQVEAPKQTKSPRVISQNVSFFGKENIDDTINDLGFNTKGLENKKRVPLEYRKIAERKLRFAAAKVQSGISVEDAINGLKRNYDINSELKQTLSDFLVQFT